MFLFLQKIDFIDVATGSLGQGLGMAAGMAYTSKNVDKTKQIPQNRIFLPLTSFLISVSVFFVFLVMVKWLKVLFGKQWLLLVTTSNHINLSISFLTFLQLRLNNLVAIIDVNRLGQSQETSLGHDIDTYCKRAEAFG